MKHRTFASTQRPSCRARRSASVTFETLLAVTFVLAPLSIAMLQFGIVMTAGNQLEQVSREGARYAAAHANEASLTADENTLGSLRYYLKNVVVAQRSAIQWADMNATTPRAISTGTTSPGYVAIIFDNGTKADGSPDPGKLQSNSSCIVYGTVVSGKPVTVRVVYPMKKKVFIGTIPWSQRNGQDTSLNVLDNDYVVSSTFVVE